MFTMMFTTALIKPVFFCFFSSVFSTQDLGTLTSVNLTNPSTNGWKVATVCVHVHAAVHYGDLCGDYNGYGHIRL